MEQLNYFIGKETFLNFGVFLKRGIKLHKVESVQRHVWFSRSEPFNLIQQGCRMRLGIWFFALVTLEHVQASFGLLVRESEISSAV